MSNFKTLPIAVIICSLFFFVVLCIQSTAFYLEYQNAQHQLFIDKENSIRVIAGNLQTRLSNSLMRSDLAEAQNIVSESALNHQLKQISVIDHNHQVIISNHFRDKYMSAKTHIELYDSELFSQVIEQSNLIFRYDAPSKDLIAYVPIQIKSGLMSVSRQFNAVIFIRYSTVNALSELSYHELFELIAISLILLSSIIFLFYLINYFILKPINKLNHFSIKSDSLSTNSIKKDGYGEIGTLQESYIALVEKYDNCINELSTREQRLMYALSGSRDGLWDWNIEKNSIYFSKRWKEIIGYKFTELEDTVEQWESLIHKDDIFLVAGALKQHFIGKQSFFDITYRILTRSGDYNWILTRGQTVSWDENGHPLRIVGTTTDISKFKESQINQDYYAHFDAVTQLPNRNQLILNIEKEIARSQRNFLFGAVIFIDCNQYKMINHLQGHYQGEELLFSIARRMEETISESDIIAHLTSCEFGILLPDLHKNRDNAAALAFDFCEKLNQSLAPAFFIEDEEIVLSCAFGIELFPFKNSDANALLRQASMALKFSEENLFSNIFFFSKEIEDNINERQAMQKQIHFGLINDEFSLNFQPRVDSKGTLIGVEALSRWKHTKKGWMNPADFISVAEDSELIFRLGDWVVKTSFEQLAKWESIGLPDTFTTLSLNVSPKQFLQVGFIDSIKQHLQETKINPNLIEIEITENLLLKHREYVITQMKKLRSLGLRFAIDDFGTDYSSFSYLSLLPVSTLKIDQFFIQNLMQCNNQQLIVKAIIKLALSLKLDVVAEGVESEQQLSFLIAEGCTQFQGYYVGSPMAIDDFQTFLFDK